MHLLKKIILAVLFMTAAYAVFAQEISMEELINMCNFPATKIDSTLRSRDFVKTKVEDDSGYSQTKYTYLSRTDTSLQQRTFILRLKNDVYIELQYEVYQWEEAASIIEWLTKNGFKKQVSRMPNVNSSTPFEFIEYRKKKQIVGYEENELNSIDKKQKVYVFSVNNIDFL